MTGPAASVPTGREREPWRGMEVVADSDENPWQVLAYEAIARLRHDRAHAAFAADLAARLYVLSERYDRAL